MISFFHTVWRANPAGTRTFLSCSWLWKRAFNCALFNNSTPRRPRLTLFFISPINTAQHRPPINASNELVLYNVIDGCTNSVTIRPLNVARAMAPSSLLRNNDKPPLKHCVIWGTSPAYSMPHDYNYTNARCNLASFGQPSLSLFTAKKSQKVSYDGFLNNDG